MRVDAHHHLWADPAQVPWLTDPGHEALLRPFEMDDLLPHLTAAGIEGTVVVEAGTRRHDEIEHLLDSAERRPHILGAIGWVDTRTPEREVAAQIDRAFANPRSSWLKGLRIQVQTEPADHPATPPAERAALELAARGRVTELVLRPEHLGAAGELARRVPQARIVLDHAGKPNIAGHTSEEFGKWRTDMGQLSRCPNVYVKVSGLATEAKWSDWGWQDLLPYVSELVELFRPDRLMMGSDWPVCLLAGEYADTITAIEQCLADLPANDMALIAGGTARRVYELDSCT